MGKSCLLGSRFVLHVICLFVILVVILVVFHFGFEAFYF